MKKQSSEFFTVAEYKVIGHTDGIRRCSAAPVIMGDCYIFYQNSGLNIATCKLDSLGTIVDTKTYDQVFTTNSTDLFTFRVKRFSHNVPSTDLNGVVHSTKRDLYFISTSLYISQNQYPGWATFAAANPTFPLVTNNSNNVLPMTTQLLADMQAVNAAVNGSHTYVAEPAGQDVWRIMATGETGDCEDFALTKAKALLDLGYHASALHIECGVTNEATPVGHAWLVVQTTTGDWALDISTNSIVANADLKHGTFPLVDLILRFRQIGINWAAISPFSWMVSSANYAGTGHYFYLYILDPLLNILYYVGSAGNDMADCYGMFDQYGFSINFSPDNNFIYWTNPNLYKYRLEENKLTLVAGPGQAGGAPVRRDGTFASPWPYNYPADGDIHTRSVTSQKGYYEVNDIFVTSSLDYAFVGGSWPGPNLPYDYENTVTWINNWSANTIPASVKKVGSIVTTHYWSPDGYNNYSQGVAAQSWNQDNAVTYHPGLYMSSSISKNLTYQEGFDASQKPPETYLWTNPFGGTVDGHTVYGEFWNDLEIGDVKVQGFNWVLMASPYTRTKQMYKDGSPFVSALTSAVGTTEANLLGFAYIPNTDRLNTGA